jgi:hypothetical protein
MKHLTLLIMLAALISCKQAGHLHNIAVKDTVIVLNDFAHLVDTLSNDYYEGRETGTPGIDKAAIYIENYLKLHQIRPYYQNYRDSFMVYNVHTFNDVNDRQAFNIIGLIEGNDPLLKNELIILSAHYDHEGKSKNLEDSVYNGANDNATGVSTVLNIARILAKNKTNKRSVLVALFSAEELGLLGSEDFAKKLKKAGVNVYCGVNVDMIGSVFDKKPGKVYLSGYRKSNMAQIYNSYLGSEEVLYWKKEENYGLFSASDNYYLYRILNIPAHTFCTFDFDNYPHYHRLSDEIDKIDMTNTLTIANNILRGFIKIAESDSKEIRLN